MLQAAQIYFRRFYLKVTMAEYDPYLIAVACLYLASKTCEGAPVSNPVLVSLLTSLPSALSLYVPQA